MVTFKFCIMSGDLAQYSLILLNFYSRLGDFSTLFGVFCTIFVCIVLFSVSGLEEKKKRIKFLFLG